MNSKFLVLFLLLGCGVKSLPKVSEDEAVRSYIHGEKKEEQKKKTKKP
ncbi:MAG: hypothetical protein ACPGJV_08010 [Bacteriovoracaceae bacterium]